MRVKSIHLKNFKRFTDLRISSIPETAKLIVVTGPNGSGKSSLFDAFISWHRVHAGWGIDGDQSYYEKGTETEFSWFQSAVIDTHEDVQPSKESLYVRTAYRNDPEFTVGVINKLASPSEQLRVHKSIQIDQVVGENYQRLIYDTVSKIYDTGNDAKTVQDLRNELIGNLQSSMKSVFGDLILNNLTDPLGDGTFKFQKGTVSSYKYRNLSGGEKAAFDLLLDIHIKRQFYKDTVYCIDEIETHLHTRVQGTLLKELYALVPETSQLWITTHSLGVMRAAQELSVDAPGTVAFIEFDGFDPDAPSEISPSNIDRIAWEKMLSIALDDLSSRIIPSTIVVCEGSAIGSRRKNFDAEIYNRILCHSTPNIVFVSGGGSNQVAATSLAVKSALSEIANGARVVSLCDRDNRSPQEVRESEKGGHIVLGARNLESHLFAEDVLAELARSVGQEDKTDDVLRIRKEALSESIERGNPADDLKSAAGDIYTKLLKLLKLERAGNNTDSFMRDTLAQLIKPGMPTHDALKSEILDRL